MFHAQCCIGNRTARSTFVQDAGSRGQEVRWVMVCFSPTEALDITIVFVTQLDQIDFTEAHRSSQAVLIGPARPHRAWSRESDSCRMMANLFGFYVRCSCHMDICWMLRAFTHWGTLDLKRLFGVACLKRGCRGSVSCFSFTCCDATSPLCTNELCHTSRGGSSRRAAALPEKCKAKDSAKRPNSP